MIEERVSNEDKQRISAAIARAESNTSGEIHVHIDSKCKVDVMEMARAVFFKLGMEKTALRNGVLFYLAVDDKKFAILGDEGIDRVTPNNFWEEIKNLMSESLKDGKIVDALENGVLIAGESLKQYFPYKDDDINELDDEVTFGN